jgi:hypothetical protein
VAAWYAVDRLSPPGPETVVQRVLHDRSLSRATPRDDQETDNHEHAKTGHDLTSWRVELAVRHRTNGRDHDQVDE